MKVGDDYFDSAEFSKLLNAYETSVNAGEPVFMDADELTDIADYYQYTGRTDEAEKAISLALSLSPGAIAPLTYRIHEAIFKGDNQKARLLLDQIIETSEPDYIYDKAEILISEGKIDEANQYLTEQLELISSDERQDFIIDVVNIFSEWGQPGKAMEWITKGNSEDTPSYKELMGRTLFEMGKFKESQNIFNELVDAYPFSNRYWTALASAQYMSEDYSDSVQSSEYAIAIDPNDPAAMLTKANGLIKLENFEEALKFYNKYIEQIPDDELALMQKSYCLTNLNQFDEALSTLKQAEEIISQDASERCAIYQEEAFILAELGRTDEALEQLNKTDAFDCDHVEMLVIKGHIMLAAQRQKEAQNYFAEALANSQDRMRTMLHIIVSVYENKYVESAYNLFKEFFEEIDADFNEGYAYMAHCCHALKHYDEYLLYLKQACNRNPQECKQILGHLFPQDLAPEEYYHYTINKIKQQQ